MGVLYWLFAILMGASMGIGFSFLIMSALLNKSNNMGDSRLKNEEFSSNIVYLSQQSNMSGSQQLMTDYVEMNLEALTRSRDYLNHCEKGLRANPGDLVERYFPTEDDSSEVSAFDSVEGVEAAENGNAGGVVSGSDSGESDGLLPSPAVISSSDGFSIFNPAAKASSAQAPKPGVVGVSTASGALGSTTSIFRGDSSNQIGYSREVGATSSIVSYGTLGSNGQTIRSNSSRGESAWAASRRRNMGSGSIPQATTGNGTVPPVTRGNSGASRGLGVAPVAGGAKMDEPVMDLSAMEAPKDPPKRPASDFDDFWFGTKKTTPAASATPADSVAAGTPASTGISPVAPAASGMDEAMDSVTASPFSGNLSSPAPAEPIYEAPTAKRPLWENTNENDDFSDFEDFM
ncbi:MAG: hypothetical protein J5379_09270 [Clostridiales bacterium]|nr:hypothetical protein [Clostridiales bacterium]